MAYLQTARPVRATEPAAGSGCVGLDAEPVQELVEDAAVSVSSPADPDVLPQAQVLHLVPDPGLLPVSRPLGLVGFDAPDVMGRALHQGLDQTVGLFLEEGGQRSRTGLVSGHHNPLRTRLTLILLLAVVGRPRFSTSRFSGNSALMNRLTTNTSQIKLPLILKGHSFLHHRLK